MRCLKASKLDRVFVVNDKTAGSNLIESAKEIFALRNQFYLLFCIYCLYIFIENHIHISDHNKKWKDIWKNYKNNRKTKKVSFVVFHFCLILTTKLLRSKRKGKVYGKRK